MGAAPHGDQDALRLQPLQLLAMGVMHGHAVGIRQAAPAAHQLHPRLLQKADVQLVEPIHLRPHAAEQFGAVALAGSHAPAVAGGIRQQVAHGGAVHQQLLGHAAADHAGAAHPIPLHDRHPRAVGRGPLGRRQAAGAGADHHQIKAVSHGFANQDR